MSIIIKGMEMPDSCYFCRMRTEYGFCMAKPLEFCGYTDDVKRPDWCPLVEISKGARLIDAEALYSDIIHRFDYCDDFLEMFEDAPTIFEEDKE